MKESGKRGGDVGEEISAPLFVSEEAVGAQGLHEALGCAAPIDGLEGGVGRGAGFGEAFLIEAEKGELFGLREGDVGIEQEGGEVVLGQAEAHALEVDQARGMVEQEDILGLEIAVNQSARQSGKLGGKGGEGFASGLEGGGRETEMTDQAILEEVVLFPKIEGFVEGRLEAEGKQVGRGDLAGETVEFKGLLEDGFVEGAADGPGFIPEAPEIAVAEVFHPDAAGLGFMSEHVGDAQAVGFEELGDLNVVGVLEPESSVLDEDEAGEVVGLEAEEAPIGAPFFEGLDVDGGLGEVREMGPGELKDFLEVLGHAKSTSEWEPLTCCPEVTMQRRRWVPGAIWALGQRMVSSRWAWAPMEAPGPTAQAGLSWAVGWMRAEGSMAGLVGLGGVARAWWTARI